MKRRLVSRDQVLREWGLHDAAVSVLRFCLFALPVLPFVAGIIIASVWEIFPPSASAEVWLVRVVSVALSGFGVVLPVLWQSDRGDAVRFAIIYAGMFALVLLYGEDAIAFLKAHFAVFRS